MEREFGARKSFMRKALDRQRANELDHRKAKNVVYMNHYNRYVQFCDDNKEYILPIERRESERWDRCEMQLRVDGIYNLNRLLFNNPYRSLGRQRWSVVGNIKKYFALRLQAELELKNAAIDYAKKETDKEFDEGITLRVFQHIRTDPHLCGLYKRAIGGKNGFGRRNLIKARVNRTLGAAIKTAVGAIPKTINGKVLKAQVTGELIQSYTLLGVAVTRHQIPV